MAVEDWQVPIEHNRPDKLCTSGVECSNKSKIILTLFKAMNSKLMRHDLQ